MNIIQLFGVQSYTTHRSATGSNVDQKCFRICCFYYSNKPANEEIPLQHIIVGLTNQK